PSPCRPFGAGEMAVEGLPRPTQPKVCCRRQLRVSRAANGLASCRRRATVAPINASAALRPERTHISAPKSNELGVTTEGKMLGPVFPDHAPTGPRPLPLPQGANYGQKHSCWSCCPHFRNFCRFGGDADDA